MIRRPMTDLFDYLVVIQLRFRGLLEMVIGYVVAVLCQFELRGAAGSYMGRPKPRVR
jgi:hypothetical protein